MPTSADLRQYPARAGVSRQLASDPTFYSSYTQTDRLTLAPSWQIGKKTALSLRYDIARRDHERHRANLVQRPSRHHTFGDARRRLELRCATSR